MEDMYILNIIYLWTITKGDNFFQHSLEKEMGFNLSQSYSPHLETQDI